MPNNENNAAEFNHAHLCELKMLFGKYMKRYCPYKYSNDLHDECDCCKHLRIVRLSDDGLNIKEIT